jgi:flagellin-like protein
MKKSWTKRKKEAVSPVIATILMVAITVVLAATLYFTTVGFSSGNRGYAPSITMTFQKDIEGDYSFTVAGVTKNDIKWSDILGVCDPSGVVDLPGTTYVGAGDIVTISGLHAGTTYSITLKYTPSGSACYQRTLTAM